MKKILVNSCLILAMVFGAVLTSASTRTNDTFSGWKWPLPAGSWTVTQGPHEQYPNGCFSHCDSRYWVNYEAIDIAPHSGSLPYILAVADGTVKFASDTNFSSGNVVKILHDNGLYSIYLHLGRILVKVGDRVAQGDKIGVMGNSGSGRPASTGGTPLTFGAHLHFTITTGMTSGPVSPAGLEGYAIGDKSITSSNAATGDSGDNGTTPIGNPPSAPGLSSPSNYATAESSTVMTFKWNSSSEATAYYMEYWGGPYQGSLNSGWIGSTSFKPGTFWPGTYFWRVKARNSNGTSNWSDTWTFTIKDASAGATATPTSGPTALQKPSLSNPGNGAYLNTTTDVNLNWNTTSDAAQYKVELWGGPYDTMTPCDWQSGTSCHIGQMSAGTMSWHVKARNSSGQESDWSDTWTFTVQGPTVTASPLSPDVPTLSNPKNGGVFPSTKDVTLSWNAANNATKYKVEMWGGEYSLMTVCDWQSGTSCHIGPMWLGTVYWHVKARNDSSLVSEWSETWSFTIADSATPTFTPTVFVSSGRPNLSSPGNGSSMAQKTEVTLSWQSAANASQYKVELWGGPYDRMVPCEWVSATSCWIGTMWPGQMYWRVKSRTSSGQESEWSDTWTFTIQEMATSVPPTSVPPTSVPPTAVPPTAVPPQAWKPSLSSPGNNSSWPRSTEITLNWNGLSGASQYKVELWGGPYDRMVPCEWVSRTSCWIGTMWPGTMYWRVKARGSSGESEWSDTWTFVIQG